MKNILTLSAVVLLGLVNSALANEILPPEDQDVKSPNGQYLLDINAKSGLHELRKGATSFGHSREECGMTTITYQTMESLSYGFWENIQADDVKNAALTVYSGRVALKKTFAEIGTPRPYKKDEIGPIGDFWRIWRSKINREEDVISIAVEGKKEDFKIDLAKMGERRKSRTSRHWATRYPPCG